LQYPTCSSKNIAWSCSDLNLRNQE
jgi:hypothetical protein